MDHDRALPRVAFLDALQTFSALARLAIGRALVSGVVVADQSVLGIVARATREFVESHQDPIARFLQDWERIGKPSLAWVVEHSGGDGDPLQYAWDLSKDGSAMFRLVQAKKGWWRTAADHIEMRCVPVRSYEYEKVSVLFGGMPLSESIAIRVTGYRLVAMMEGVRIELKDGALVDVELNLSLAGPCTRSEIYPHLLGVMMRRNPLESGAHAMRAIYPTVPPLALWMPDRS